MSRIPARTGSALDDPARLNSLSVLDLLSNTPSEDLDRLTRLASKLIRTPVAFVTIVDKDRNFFKSNVGAPGVTELPLTHSFCQHVVTSGQSLIVDDVTTNDLVKSNLAIRDFGVGSYAGTPIFAPTGEALGTICVLDTKPRHWTEDEISVLEDLASAAMVEIGLRESSVRLKEEQLLREETMNLLVHDFRTPLSIINAAAQTALVDQSSLEEMLTITLSSTERMQGLVNDLLALGKLEQGHLQPKLSPENLSQLLAQMVRDLLPFAKESDVALEDHACPDLPLVLVDAGLISRVISNLLSNAIRYTHRST
jgi:GAF domain-containing protein